MLAFENRIFFSFIRNLYDFIIFGGKLTTFLEILVIFHILQYFRNTGCFFFTLDPLLKSFYIVDNENTVFMKHFCFTFC